jgi:ATP-dependent exoDNAse (exonuclease V) beta subunit
MSDTATVQSLPDAAARVIAIADHHRSLLVEAGAGSGKTAIMASRVALLLAEGVPPKCIVAITFTEPAAAELQERIEGTVQRLLQATVPIELLEVLPHGLSTTQRTQLKLGADALDEITCTTIHGFCQRLIKPYAVETGIDPGAAIIDPHAAELAYQDLMDAWLSARFGRDRGAEGLGRIPAITGAGGEDDFFAELLDKDPDETLKLIRNAAQFLKTHRTAGAAITAFNGTEFTQLSDSVRSFADWYAHCGVSEATTTELILDLQRIACLAEEAGTQPLTGRRIADLLFHVSPTACKKDGTTFKQWGRKGKWKDAGKAVGISAARSEQLNAIGHAHYDACGAAYEVFCQTLGSLAFQRFVSEFSLLKDLYRDYKRAAALLDFDDLLHHAAELLKSNETVRQALAKRFPVILVDEFQDTDPLQAEILWRLAGDGDPASPWHERVIRPGALFLVGDPKQAIYRFRGADVETYLVAKRSIATLDATAILDVSANFRSQPAILEYVNSNFSTALDESQGQPGFRSLSPVRASNHEPSVAAFEIALDDRHKSNGRLVRNLVRQEEAAIVADIVRGLIGTYPVWDKDLQTYRSARAGDIALLAPTGTSLWLYEQELESRHVRIATQAGKGFFRRQEVQDLIAIARTIADHRDTLAFGALIRGPLVGLSEEEIADEIEILHTAAEPIRFYLWTDQAAVRHPVLKQTLAVLQNLARKARRTTPYQLLSEAVEELHVRPLLKARHSQGAERALANVELVLEMARAYGGRGIGDFSHALWQRWNDGDAQAEGRPDAEADAVSIITIHSAKGLEWPIVIPINSTTTPRSDTNFMYRRADDSVHFKVFGFSSRDYDIVNEDETAAVRSERVRLWYVALTRARDLLLMPRQTERIANDWLSLVDLAIETLPQFDSARFRAGTSQPVFGNQNSQDLSTWQKQAETIAASERSIIWHQPSRHDQSIVQTPPADHVLVGPEATSEAGPESNGDMTIQGGRERGVVLHKLMEEVLTGETPDDLESLQLRAAELLVQLGMADEKDAANGLSSMEMATAVQRTLKLQEIAELRPRLLPEFQVYAATVAGQKMSLTAGIADAVAHEHGRIHTIIDWKSDVNPTPAVTEAYREQVRSYLKATGAVLGLIVFVTSGRIESVNSVV